MNKRYNKKSNLSRKKIEARCDKNQGCLEKIKQRFDKKQGCLEEIEDRNDKIKINFLKFNKSIVKIVVDKEKFGKIQQEYSKNQTCLEKKLK